MVQSSSDSSHSYQVFCPYPKCQRVFRLPRQPSAGETLRCAVCRDPFMYQVAYQRQKIEGCQPVRQPSRNLPPLPLGGRGNPPQSNRLMAQWGRWSLVAVVVVALVAATAGGIWSFVGAEETDDQRDTVSRPRPTALPRPAVNSTPTLREYWDLAACLDLADRVDAATFAGLSDEQIVLGMANADGAIKRYGVNEVLEHCTDVLRDFNSR